MYKYYKFILFKDTITCRRPCTSTCINAHNSLKNLDLRKLISLFFLQYYSKCLSLNILSFQTQRPAASLWSFLARPKEDHPESSSYCAPVLRRRQISDKRQLSLFIRASRYSHKKQSQEKDENFLSFTFLTIIAKKSLPFLTNQFDHEQAMQKSHVRTSLMTFSFQVKYSLIYC